MKDSKKPEELNSYVTQYPNGQFKALALSRMAALENGTLPDKEKSDVTRNLTAAVDPATFTDDSTQLTEDQIGLDKGQRRDVQRRLTGLGFDTKVTGVFNDDTRMVIKRWQAARGYPVTGYLNKLQHKALLGEIVSASGAAGATTTPPRHRKIVRAAAAVAEEAVVVAAVVVIVAAVAAVARPTSSVA